MRLHTETRTPTMNLALDPWIPATHADGHSKKVSLCDVFASGETLRDLAVRPHERIALMRLLICIAQAALDGPENEAKKESAARALPQAASDYLKKWSAHFSLFDEKFPFLQMPGLSKPPKPAKGKKPTEDADLTAVSKLDFALATGANTTLFDHGAARKGSRAFVPEELAMGLLTFQCFSPGGLIGVATWNGQETPGSGSSGHAPCSPSGMLHAIVCRPTLLQTICANILTKQTIDRNYRQPWGKPIWEMFPSSFADSPGLKNATRTYLGRLIPISRAILLRSDGATMIFANGFDYPTPPDFPPEPTATLVAKRDGSGHALVGAGSRAIWRQLPALVVKRSAGNPGGPLVLLELEEPDGFDLWVGALVTDKASILDSVESVYSIPPRLLDDAGRVLYEEEIRECERVANALGEACKKFRQLLELKPQKYGEQAVALRYFWNAAEQKAPLLLVHLRAEDGSEDAAGKLSAWRGSLWQAAREAFRFACPQATPRQQRAHAVAAGLLHFSRTKETKKSSGKKKP
jgi:CRISPR system Cascade subunit CasA